MRGGVLKSAMVFRIPAVSAMVLLKQTLCKEPTRVGQKTLLCKEVPPFVGAGEVIPPRFL